MTLLRSLAAALLSLSALTAVAQPAPVAPQPAPAAASATGDSTAALLPAVPAALPRVSITLNGRPTDIEVENLANPLVLIQTTRGDMVMELFPAEAPRTVENFLALAEGTRPFTDPATGAQVQRPFYDGLPFHRIVQGFLIQGGSPTGGGYGGPGYTIPDEINAVSLGLDRMPLIDREGYPNPLLDIPDQAAFQQTILKPLYASMGIRSSDDIERRSSEIETRLRNLSLKGFYELQGYRYNESSLSRAPLRGMLAMAGSGAGTAGSQFFITLADTPWLAGRHTVFGKLRAGESVLDSIGRVPVGPDHRPLEAVNILLIRRIAL